MIGQQRIERHLNHNLTLNFSRFNVIRNFFWTPPVNLASDRIRSAENLLDRAIEILLHGFESHLASNLNDLIERNRLAVLDVLFFFSCLAEAPSVP
jgi:hypothetical protein